MGLFFRKSLNYGPFRLNFSKSGLGLSFGVKGFRISKNSRGTYLHAGRKGLYMREKLDKKTNSLPEEASTSEQTVVIRISEELNEYIKKIKKECILPFIIGTILAIAICSADENFATMFECIVILAVLIRYGILNNSNTDLHKSYKEILEMEAVLNKRGIAHVREVGDPEEVEEYDDNYDDVDILENLED